MTYFFMLLFVFWTAYAIALNTTPTLWMIRIVRTGEQRVWARRSLAALYAALATFFFYNIW